MKKKINAWLVTAGALLLSVQAAAQVADANSCDEVARRFAAGESAQDIVRWAMTTDRTLLEATIFTLVCGGEGNRVAVAGAGIGLSDTLGQAQSVAYGLRRTAGETGPVALAVDEALRTYIERMPQPGIHEDEYTPHGTGVSPAT